MQFNCYITYAELKLKAADISPISNVHFANESFLLNDSSESIREFVIHFTVLDNSLFFDKGYM